MKKNPRFIVMEGLDGAGKSTALALLAGQLEAVGFEVLQTLEPHTAYCGGNFIRQVLAKKITGVHPRTLALAFAANRLDHCDREIRPWLAASDRHIVLCDRYYLSSLVYQHTPDFPFEKVMELNELALQPDVTFFLNVREEVCFDRLSHRNLPKELFEENFPETRRKFEAAIAFLKETRQEPIVEIDGNGRVEETVGQVISVLKGIGVISH